MNKLWAHLVSYIAHPALIPAIGVSIILFLSPHYIAQPVFLIVMLYVFLGTYIFPLLMAILLMKLGLLSGLSMENASERRLPYLSAALFYFMTARSMVQFPVPDAVGKFLLAGVLIIGVSFTLLRWTKISAHMAGIASLLALIVQLSISFKMQMLVYISLLVLLCGIVGTARLVLRAHSPAEVYFGFFLGIISVFAALNM